jgi:hypothetical protein
MTVFLIIYAIGIFINAIVAASIYDDLTEDHQLERVRLVAITFFVLASVFTWAYMLLYLVVKIIINLFKRKPKSDGDKNDN